MKKTIITSLVAVAALGFSGTSFAGGSITNVPVFNPEYESTTVDNDVIAPDLFSHNTTTSTFAPTSTSTFAPTLSLVDSSTNINAATGAPAAGGNLTIFDIEPVDVIVHQDGVANILTDLDYISSVATANPSDGSGNASGIAGLALNPIAAGGDTGNVNPVATAGAASIGNIDVNLSASATSLVIVGGSYEVVPTVAP